MTEPQHIQVILDDVPDDAELVEVTPAAVGAERLLEGDLDVRDVLVVPHAAKHLRQQQQQQGR